ncbi:MAG TPA: molybdenum cofactor guanylyltransferase [Opitutus sp.]|nr:molybdenum cofactor guanylyltransferase [Opitutus sp.]
MIAGGTLAGAVLAGGESRRMGTDKAHVRIGREVLWRRQVRTLRAAGMNAIAVVRRPEQARLQAGTRTLTDLFSGVGPLAGVHVALATFAGASHVAMLAVDMPRLEPEWFRWLGVRCAPGIGAVTRTRRGYEPLVAIYPVEAERIARRRLEAGRGSLQDFVAELVRARRLRVLTVEPDRILQLANWNSPEDRK